jgi:prolyl 4-hydroxylase
VLEKGRKKSNYSSSNSNSNGNIMMMILQHWLSMVPWIFVILLVASQLPNANGQQAQNHPAPPQTCRDWAGPQCGWEPNMKPMTVDFGHGNTEVFYAYQPPDVSTFYNKTAGTLKAQKPRFTGMFGKFINLSPTPLTVYWVSDNPKEPPVYISTIEPFGASGTATYPGHQFLVRDSNDPKKKPLIQWHIVAGNMLYYYDPYQSNMNIAQKHLTPEQLSLYHMQLANRHFAETYYNFTGNQWLALYKQKAPPRFHMWRADYFGQTFAIETKEIHFVELPDATELTRGTSPYGPRPDERSRMRRHRARDPALNLTLTVLSCSPRVFEIRNFLSDTEIQHILDLAARLQLQKSTTRSGDSSDFATDERTRTSTNSWIARNTDLVMDAIYRRAADVLQIDEALLRWRRATEIPEFSESKISIAERLQLVHYGVGEQYTAHHDFMIPTLVKHQPTRFATLLFYLNDEGLEGGETSFPRWVNVETSGELKVKPEKGKAVLFYNILPDGNNDERSQHAALPVIQGEKWLTNLWVWDPLLDHTAAAHI